MSTAFIDIRWGLASGEEPIPNAGWIRYSGSRDYPSPALLHTAAAASAPVDFHYLSRQEAQELPERLRARLPEYERVVIAAPSIHRLVAESLRTTLSGAQPGLQVTLLDPWTVPAVAELGYELAHGQTAAHAELDSLPYRDAVHPWACPLPPSAPTVDGWEARLLSAVASFAPRDPAQLKRPIWQAWERDLHLNDPRIPLTMDRVRAIARLVSRGLKEHSTMLKLHLSAWPKDLLENPRVPDHLTLLPVGALDLLVGSLYSGGSLPGACSTEEIVKSFAAIQSAGLSHVTGVSLVLGLPGQSAEDCLKEIQDLVKAMLAAKILRVRFVYWLGSGAPLPTSAEHMAALFMASHPGWHPIEYAGLFDFIALLKKGMKQMEIIGPGFSSDWASSVEEAPAA